MLAPQVSEPVATIAAQVKEAVRPIQIVGSGSRQQFGQEVIGDTLVCAELDGVIDYQPTELFVRVGAGMQLAKLQKLLADQKQCLAADITGVPTATIGGSIACGIDGPCRLATGSMRDHLLGVSLLNGKGELMQFGGNLIKNVAGFDVSRLQVGALGTLGVLTEVSLRTRGLDKHFVTLVQELDVHDAIGAVNKLIAHGQPISASVWVNGNLYLRLAGSKPAIQRAGGAIDGDEFTDAEDKLWQPLRELHYAQLAKPGPIWLCQVPPLTQFNFDELGIIDWHGQRRWFFGDAPPNLREQVTAAGGSAILWQRGPGMAEIPTFPPLPAAVQRLHERIKKVFDPQNILNPHRCSNF